MFGHIRGKLSAYCHGELTAAESGRVGGHLRGCEGCRNELDQIELGVALAGHLTMVSAPAGLWSQIEARLEQGAQQEAAASWPRWLNAQVLLAGAALLVLAVWLGTRSPGPPLIAPSSGDQPVAVAALQFDLGEYLRPVQAAPTGASYLQVSSAPPRFEDRDPASRHRVAWLDGILHGPAPLSGYDLVAYRRQPVRNAEVVQLVYGNRKEAFSVFIAPRWVDFTYGRETAYDTEVSGIRCRKLDCPKQQTYEFGEGGVKCVLVSKSFDDQRAAAVMSYFLAAYRTPK